MHVRAAGDQGAAVAHRDRLFELQRAGADGGLRRQVARGAAGEGGKPEQGGIALGVQRRHRGLALVAQGGDPNEIEPFGLPGIHAVAGHAHGFVEQGHRLLRNLDLPCGGCGIGISAHRVGDYLDTHGVQVVSGGAQIATGGFQAAAHPAEQIDFVVEVDAAIDAPVTARFARQGFEGGDLLIDRGAADGGLRIERRPRAAKLGLGAFQMRHRNPNIGICGQRIGHQPIEHRVVIQAPPAIFDGGSGGDLPESGGDERRVSCCLRADEIRTDRAGGKARGGDKQNGEAPAKVMSGHGSIPHSAG